MSKNRLSMKHVQQLAAGVARVGLANVHGKTGKAILWEDLSQHNVEIGSNSSKDPMRKSVINVVNSFYEKVNGEIVPTSRYLTLLTSMKQQDTFVDYDKKVGYRQGPWLPRGGIGRAGSSFSSSSARSLPVRDLLHFAQKDPASRPEDNVELAILAAKEQAKEKKREQQEAATFASVHLADTVVKSASKAQSKLQELMENADGGEDLVEKAARFMPRRHHHHHHDDDEEEEKEDDDEEGEQKKMPAMEPDGPNPVVALSGEPKSTPGATGAGVPSVLGEIGPNGFTFPVSSANGPNFAAAPGKIGQTGGGEPEQFASEATGASSVSSGAVEANGDKYRKVAHHGRMGW